MHPALQPRAVAHSTKIFSTRLKFDDAPVVERKKEELARNNAEHAADLAAESGKVLPLPRDEYVRNIENSLHVYSALTAFEKRDPALQGMEENDPYLLYRLRSIGQPIPDIVERTLRSDRVSQVSVIGLDQDFRKEAIIRAGYKHLFEHNRRELRCDVFQTLVRFARKKV